MLKREIRKLFQYVLPIYHAIIYWNFYLNTSINKPYKSAIYVKQFLKINIAFDEEKLSIFYHSKLITKLLLLSESACTNTS